MKKKLFLISFLFLGFISLSHPFSKNIYSKTINLDQNDKIINLETGTNSSGITIDTDLDGFADTLYMWGSNSSGQLGDNTNTSKRIPTIITPNGQSDWNGNIIDLSLGLSHSGVTVDTDLDGFADTLYMWGSNSSGQLGDNTNTSKRIPTIITPNGQSDWNGNLINLELGEEYSGVTVDNDLDGFADTLYMWGSNTSYGLGDGTSIDKKTPTKITPSGQSDWNGNLINLELGYYHHSGITVDTDLDGFADTLYMWGYNTSGQIGDNTTATKQTPTKITPSGQSDWNGDIIDLSLGGNYSGVTVDTNFDDYADTLYMWGNNSLGQLGNNSSTSKTIPTKITPSGQSNWEGNLIDLDLGDYHSGVTVDTNFDDYADTLYMWGNNSSGQIGDNTTINQRIPRKITPSGQSDWNGNLINLSLGENHTGTTIDTNSDGYGDTLYMWGNNEYGQLGDNTIVDKYFPTIIISNSSFLIKNLNFYNINHDVEIDLTLNDYQNIINTAPEVILTDSENNNYVTTFIASKSDILNDQYYYQLDDTLSGKNYNFTQITINGNTFDIDQNIITDYIISDYTFASSTEETITIDLNLGQNSDDFNILDYSEDQRKINVNYTNIANNLKSSQQFILDEDSQVTLTDLNAETNYRIDSIQYFYQSNDYKYPIETQAKIFQTSAATPLINANSISLIENSLTENSFEYTIEIDNLKENDSKDNFTQYDINNGIWLIDQEGQTYNSSFISEELISNGQINGTQNYQLTFLQEDLIAGQTYSFAGIGFNDPNGSDPDTINFSSIFEVTTILINKKFVDGSFAIDSESVTTNSFQYTIAIDDLILIDNSGSEPVFDNFDPNEDLYLKDQDDNIKPSSYINNTALNLGSGEEEGTVKYQFSFKVNNLNQNTTYNFTELSFTGSFEESINISEFGTITTANNANEKIAIWVIIIILFIIILFILILIWVDLRMKKRTKEISDRLNNSDFE